MLTKNLAKALAYAGAEGDYSMRTHQWTFTKGDKQVSWIDQNGKVVAACGKFTDDSYEFGYYPKTITALVGYITN